MYKHSTLLLKGARRFQLEQLIPLINRRLNASYLQVNLDALSQNLRFFKSQIPASTKIMCMVKAFSYGSGTWETAQVLEREGVDYLGVAFASEAIELRQRGLKLPIMVVNPDISSLHALAEYGLEPQIINLDLLTAYIRAARLAGLSSYPLHLKFDTGMGRLGFQEHELPRLIEVLSQYPDIQVISIASHLAAADDPAEDAFSRQQMATFDQIYQVLQEALGISPFRHMLNTAGVLRFPDKAMDMVRLGIGLYGINPVLTGPVAEVPLQEIASLHALISQIHSYPAGTSIGYGRSEYTERPSRIATIPIGYADGIMRVLGNGKIHFLLRGKPVPTFGRICMDMLMLDVTDVPEAQVGDEIVLFGRQGEAICLSANWPRRRIPFLMRSLRGSVRG